MDFAHIQDNVLACFDSLADLDLFFLRLQTATGVTLYEHESVIIFDEVQMFPKARQAISFRNVTVSMQGIFTCFLRKMSQKKKASNTFRYTCCRVCLKSDRITPVHRRVICTYGYRELDKMAG